MGVDFWIEAKPEYTGCCWSYCGFNDFRKRLAESIGINLDEMKGFCNDGKEWPDPKKEPLVYFLDHSDCDGELLPEECRAVWKRLHEVVSEWSDRALDYDRKKGLILAAKMRDAADGDLRLYFR
jgi:hypothetical protein